MILNKLIRQLNHHKQLNACLFCSKTVKVSLESENLQEIIPTTEPKVAEIKKQKRLASKKHILGIEQFFHDNQHLQAYRDLIPEKLLFYTPYTRPEYMYLICPKIAKTVAKHVLPTLNKSKDHVVAETSPGFGFIAKELIKRHVPVVRLYEKSLEFQEILTNMYKKDKRHLPIYNKDIFKLHLYSHVDRYDQGNRVSSLLQGVPQKSWVDDPVMTIVGTLTDLSFVKHLIKSIIFQKEIATYGRFEMFALAYPKDWATLNSTTKDSIYCYRPWTILFQVFFEVKLLDKFPRKFFLPWELHRKNKGRQVQAKGARSFDQDNLYLIQISMKKDIFLNAEEFVPFFCFIRTFLGTGNRAVIPTCEKWVPDCGVNLMVPKLYHKDYFEDMNIFTKFNELDFQQVIGVFREISSLPGYHSSPFMDMVEQEMIKSETISSDLHSTHKYKRKIADSDFETK